jgi:hypothetical protein
MVTLQLVIGKGFQLDCAPDCLDRQKQERGGADGEGKDNLKETARQGKQELAAGERDAYSLSKHRVKSSSCHIGPVQPANIAAKRARYLAALLVEETGRTDGARESRDAAEGGLVRAAGDGGRGVAAEGERRRVFLRRAGGALREVPLAARVRVTRAQCEQRDRWELCQRLQRVPYSRLDLNLHVSSSRVRWELAAWNGQRPIARLRTSSGGSARRHILYVHAHTVDAAGATARLTPRRAVWWCSGGVSAWCRVRSAVATPLAPVQRAKAAPRLPLLYLQYGP